MHIFDNLIVLKGLRRAEILNFYSKNAILILIFRSYQKQVIMLNFADFDDWHEYGLGRKNKEYSCVIYFAGIQMAH